jgi:hypothetical protein
MEDEKIRHARKVLAEHDELLALQLQALGGGKVNQAATQHRLAEALRALLPAPQFDVWEIVAVRGCHEEHRALATGLTKQGAQNYIARIDPAARRRLYAEERTTAVRTEKLVAEHGPFVGTPMGEACRKCGILKDRI